MHPIWFVLGLSGAGKSFFSHEAANKLAWFHYEIDMHPHDGITHWGFRQEWDNYLQNHQIDSLIQAISSRSCHSNCNGSILSFPSNLINCLNQQHIASAAATQIKIIVLSGSEDACLNTFLQREHDTGRNLNAEHWRENNLQLYPLLNEDCWAQYNLNAFNDDGSHKSIDTLLEEAQSI